MSLTFGREIILINNNSSVKDGEERKKHQTN